MTFGGGSSDSSAFSSTVTLTFPTFSYSNQPYGGWIAYAPLSDTFYPSFLVGVVHRQNRRRSVRFAGRPPGPSPGRWSR